MQDKTFEQIIKAPSVFADSGWVHRFLTRSEVLRILDVPKVLDELILNSSEESRESVVFNSILNSVPDKVLYRFLKLIGINLSSQTSEEAFQSSESDYKSLVSGDFNPVTEQSTDLAISVKEDDAAVPVGLWNKEFFEGTLVSVDYDPKVHDKLLESLRELWGMRWFRRRLLSSFCHYMRTKHGVNWTHQLTQVRLSSHKHKTSFARGKMKHLELLQDGAKGVEELTRAINASWWTWDEGSSLLFWRWPEEAQKDARDGSSFPWKFHPMPAYKKP